MKKSLMRRKIGIIIDSIVPKIYSNMGHHACLRETLSTSISKPYSESLEPIDKNMRHKINVTIISIRICIKGQLTIMIYTLINLICNLNWVRIEYLLKPRKISYHLLLKVS